MRFSDEFLSELKDRNNILDVISPYVDLRVSGSIARGLCPFHNERTPSFTIYINNQSFYCFGCGVGGNVITFVKNIENIGFTEAVSLLADKCGMALPADGYDDSLAKQKRRLLEANREAARFYNRYLFGPDGKKALDYFLDRGLTVETIRHFGLGYAPDKWDALLRYMKQRGFSESELISADLARKTKNGGTIDVFRNRVMFPIIDLKGSVIAFGGRVLDDSKPKYVNTSDTPVYKKSRGVFALNFAKRGTERTLILCEGYMDVIAYHQAGFTNAVAGLGTAFTQEQAKLLSRYCDEIILSYDNDEAGQRAAGRAIQILSKTTLRVRVARLHGGKDPDEIIKKYGREEMQNILNAAVGNVEFDLQRAKAGFDLTTDYGKVNYLNRSVELLARLNNPIQWDVYASRLSAEVGVTKEAITAQIEKTAKQKRRRESSDGFKKAATFNDDMLNKINPERRQFLYAAKAEETLLSSLIHNPDFYFKIKDKLSEEDFSTELNRRIFKIVAQRIEEQRPVEITYFSEDLSDEELGYLVRLESMHENLGNTIGECLDCIKRMQKEKQDRNTKNPGQMTDEEWASFFKR
ncbi:MAG: DNA primase [Clostridiales bacterium]|nr:DNA primase [Clostridiales bacterium]